MLATANLPLLSECWFYHSMDIPGVGAVEGHWDLRGKFNEYVGGVDVRGRTLLDVGTASGFLTFEAEKHGATVFAFDAESSDRYQLLPRPKKPDLRASFQQMRNGFLLAHAAHNSQSRLITGDIYRMAEIAPRTDVVLVGQILVHLRDPLAALEQASQLADEYLIITEGSFTSPHPSALFLGRDGNEMTWWHYSDELYRQWLTILGFEIKSITKAVYGCNAPAMPSQMELWTFVSKRA